MIRKKLITLGISTIIVASMAVPAFAGTEGHTLTVTAARATATFSYGNGGNLLEVEMGFTERHSSSGHIYSGTVYDSANGADTTAKAIRDAGTSYVLARATSTAKLNNTVYNVIEKVLP